MTTAIVPGLREGSPYADVQQVCPKLARPAWVRLIAPVATDAALSALLTSVQESGPRLPIAKRRKLAKRGIPALVRALRAA